MIALDKYDNVDKINLKNIHQVYGDNVVFDNLNFSIKDVKDAGQFIVIVGESGCGKCFTESTSIKVRNKHSGKIEELSIKEFKKRLP